MLAARSVDLNDVDTWANAVENVATHIAALVLLDHNAVRLISVMHSDSPPCPAFRRAAC